MNKSEVVLKVLNGSKGRLFTKREVAVMTNSTALTVSAVLSGLVDNGLVRKVGEFFTVSK